MPADPNLPQLVENVRMTTARRRKSDAKAAADTAEQADAIAAAMKAKASPSELETITGLTRARLYQIRDGRR